MIYADCDYCGREIEGEDGIATLKTGGTHGDGEDVAARTLVFHAGEDEDAPSCFRQALEALDLAGFHASGGEEDSEPRMQWRLVDTWEEQPEPEQTGGVATVTKQKVKQNRHTQARELIKARPGMTVSEIAAAMGVKANVLYRVLPQLKQQGLIRKVGKGWHPA